LKKKIFEKCHWPHIPADLACCTQHACHVAVVDCATLVMWQT